MKKYISIILAVMLILSCTLSLSACANTNSGAGDNTTTEQGGTSGGDSTPSNPTSPDTNDGGNDDTVVEETKIDTVAKMLEYQPKTAFTKLNETLLANAISTKLNGTIANASDIKWNLNHDNDKTINSADVTFIYADANKIGYYLATVTGPFTVEQLLGGTATATYTIDSTVSKFDTAENYNNNLELGKTILTKGSVQFASGDKIFTELGEVQTTKTEITNFADYINLKPKNVYDTLYSNFETRVFGNMIGRKYDVTKASNFTWSNLVINAEGKLASVQANFNYTDGNTISYNSLKIVFNSPITLEDFKGGTNFEVTSNKVYKIGLIDSTITANKALGTKVIEVAGGKVSESDQIYCTFEGQMDLSHYVKVTQVTDSTVIEYTVNVNQGDILQNLTNGKYKDLKVIPKATMFGKITEADVEPTNQITTFSDLIKMQPKTVYDTLYSNFKSAIFGTKYQEDKVSNFTWSNIEIDNSGKLVSAQINFNYNNNGQVEYSIYNLTLKTPIALNDFIGSTELAAKFKLVSKITANESDYTANRAIGAKVIEVAGGKVSESDQIYCTYKEQMDLSNYVKVTQVTDSAVIEYTVNVDQGDILQNLNNKVVDKKYKDLSAKLMATKVGIIDATAKDTVIPTDIKKQDATVTLISGNTKVTYTTTITVGDTNADTIENINNGKITEIVKASEQELPNYTLTSNATDKAIPA